MDRANYHPYSPKTEEPEMISRANYSPRSKGKEEKELREEDIQEYVHLILKMHHMTAKKYIEDHLADKPQVLAEIYKADRRKSIKNLIQELLSK